MTGKLTSVVPNGMYPLTEPPNAVEAAPLLAIVVRLNLSLSPYSHRRADDSFAGRASDLLAGLLQWLNKLVAIKTKGQDGTVRVSTPIRRLRVKHL